MEMDWNLKGGPTFLSFDAIATKNTKKFLRVYLILLLNSNSKTSLKLVFDVPEAEGNTLIEEFCKRTNPDEKNISRMHYDDYLDLAAHELNAPHGNYYHFNTYFAPGKVLSRI